MTLPLEARSDPERRGTDAGVRAAWRLRLLAACISLSALMFINQPGRIVPDTKADLVLDPGAFLGRALHLWDANGAFGQVQDQAYGYLFPMGSFFWATELVDLPAWVIQRLWWSVVVVVAFLGFVKLCSAMRLGSPGARMIGGLAFALSPRMLSILGPSSIEVWPLALAPWVLVPLVIGLRRGHPVYYAALAGLAVACVGGVNAVATFAVIPLGAILLLMAEPGSRRRSLIVWWPIFVLLGTLWWLVPLFLLGAYSPPFLDFIESGSTTTFTANLFDALRGTSHWVPYLDGSYGAGNALITNSTMILNSAVLLGLGAWGLARRDNPWGRYLVVSLMAGLAMVTLGHTGAVDGVGASGWQSALDGVLSPLRNTHKFDPMVRLPLVLGLVHLLTVLSARRVDARRPAAERRGPQMGVLLLASAALLGSTVPAWTAGLAHSGSYEAVPAYWTDAAQWLEANADGQNSLLLPGAPFGEYLWGSPRDEVLQAYAKTPYSVRNAVPLVPPGGIRTLDAIESAFASGAGSAALEAMLQRSGVRFLVVRNDLAPGRSTDPENIYSALAGMPGVRRATSFGPRVGSPDTQEATNGQTVFVNGGRQTRHRVIDVFEVEQADAESVRAQAFNSTPVVAGTPRALLLQDGLIPGATDVVLAEDAPAGFRPDNVVLTDTDRRQEVAFGRAVDNRSASLALSDTYRLDRRVHDYDAAGESRWKTVPELVGAARIRASSSLSDVRVPSIDPSRQPWSAFDQDESTRWTAGDAGEAWIEMRFEEPMSVAGTSVLLARGQPDRDLVVTTDAGSVTVEGEGGTTTQVDTPPGLTRSIRVSSPSTSFTPLSIAGIEIPEVGVSRPLRLPSMPAGWGTPDEVLLSTESGAPVCRSFGGIRRCQAGRDGLGEDGRTIDRIVALNAGADFAMGLRAQPQESLTLTDEFSGDVTLRASSVASVSPSAGLLTTIDGDPQTGWIASVNDVNPVLTLAFREQRTLSELRLVTDPSLAASAPRTARLVFDGGTKRAVRFNSSGIARFDAVTSKAVTVRIDGVRVRSSLSFDGTGFPLPVGVSEIAVGEPTANRAREAARVLRLPCGSGPEVVVGDRQYRTRVSASLAEIVAGDTVPAQLCARDPVSMERGDNRLTIRGNRAFRPTYARLSGGGLDLPTPRALETTRSDDRHLSTDPVPGRTTQLVTAAQNVNRGWAAGAPAVTVNGWMQGWVVSSGDSVNAQFEPDRWYRLSLAAGALAALGLLTMIWRLRRSPTPVSTSRAPRARWRTSAMAAALLVGVLMMGGVVGVGVAIGVGAVVLVMRRQLGEWVVGVAVVAAGLWYMLHPWNSPDGWAGASAGPQWLVLAAVSAVAVFAFDDLIVKSLSRMAGRSTKR